MIIFETFQLQNLELEAVFDAQAALETVGLQSLLILERRRRGYISDETAHLELLDSLESKSGDIPSAQLQRREAPAKAAED